MPEHAIIKFNGGRGALLCNRCNWILREDFNPVTIEDKEYHCEDFGKTCNRDNTGGLHVGKDPNQ